VPKIFCGDFGTCSAEFVAVYYSFILRFYFYDLATMSFIQSEWKDEEAEQYKIKYAKYGEDLALRVYTSRLIGRNPNCK
jgi:hypothetical protein